MQEQQANMPLVVKLLSLIMQLGLHGTGQRIPFILMGPSGIGKTEGLIGGISQNISHVIRRPFIPEVHSVPQIQVEDMSGMPVPVIEEGYTKLLPLRVGVKIEREGLAKGGAGVLAFDEFGSISNDKEAAMLNALGGVLGERIIPTEISLGAMGNPASIAANGRELSGPAANRFAWLPFELHVPSFVDYMMGGEGFGNYVELLPQGWDSRVAQCKARIGQYIKRNPEAAHNMPPPHKAGCAWNSPRSWKNAAVLSAAVEACGYRKTSDLAALAIESCVGEDAAGAYIEWLINLNLPDPEVLLADPENAHKHFPDRPDQLRVAMEALGLAAIEPREDVVARWNTAWKVLGPVLVKYNDVAIDGARHLATHLTKLPGRPEFPPEARMVKDILRQAGIIK